MSQIKGAGGAPRSKLHWITDGHGGWLLETGDFGTVRMTPDGLELPGSDSRLYLVDVVGVRHGAHPIIKLSPDAIDLETAQAIAEDYVRITAKMTDEDGDASWRDKPALATQIRYLKGKGVAGYDRLTRGTAADLMTQIQARKASTPASPKQIALLRIRGIKTPPNLTQQEFARIMAKQNRVRR
jgi:hypothetical protein